MKLLLANLPLAKLPLAKLLLAMMLLAELLLMERFPVGLLLLPLLLESSDPCCVSIPAESPGWRRMHIQLHKHCSSRSDQRSF